MGSLKAPEQDSRNACMPGGGLLTPLHPEEQSLDMKHLVNFGVRVGEDCYSPTSRTFEQQT